MKIENIYKTIEKYHWIWFIFLMVTPNFLEPTWLWRWIAIMVITVIFVTIFIWAYYAWLVLKRHPLSLTTISKHQFENLNNSQKKWHMGIFYLTTLLGGPFIFYASSFSIIDTYKAVTTNNYVKHAEITVVDRTTTMGTWFIGQSLKIEQQEISDGGLLLLFSLEHAQEGQKYKVKYLPYSGLILELDKI